MISVETLPLGELQTNCYLVWRAGGRRCAVIDPGADAEAVLARCRRLDLAVEAILLTHGHFDHVGGVEALAGATGCALWMHRADFDRPRSPANGELYPLAGRELAEIRFCEESSVIPAGGLTFTVLATPGHTAGSVCFVCEGVLFSGDTLFAGSCGRTDLPGGSPAAMAASLARLRALPGDYTVYPGHGRSTTLAEERLRNPYLRRAL